MMSETVEHLVTFEMDDSDQVSLKDLVKQGGELLQEKFDMDAGYTAAIKGVTKVVMSVKVWHDPIEVTDESSQV